MTKNEFLQTVDTVLKEAEIESSLRKLSEKAYNSGALPVDEMQEGDHSWAKIVLYAALDTIAWNIRPSDAISFEESEKLKKFI